MDFRVAHGIYGPEIARISQNARVPGMDTDDVAQEMTICLWKASVTHDPAKGPFGTYWWSLWLNRRSDITGAHHAMKRITPSPYPQEG